MLLKRPNGSTVDIDMATVRCIVGADERDREDYNLQDGQCGILLNSGHCIVVQHTDDEVVEMWNARG